MDEISLDELILGLNLLGDLILLLLLLLFIFKLRLKLIWILLDTNWLFDFPKFKAEVIFLILLDIEDFLFRYKLLLILLLISLFVSSSIYSL